MEFDLVDFIMRWEGSGDPLSADEAVTLFEHLIASGQAWSLQGAYGRAAAAFIEEGLISPEGERTALCIERLAA
jgi:hypothetical protein